MKTLRNVVISGGLFRSDGSPAVVGDTVRLYKDDGSDFEALIYSVAEINCSVDRIYTFHYDQVDIIRACEVLDQGVVLDCCALLDVRVESLEGGEGTSTPIWNNTRQITQYLTISGDAGSEIIIISDTP